MAHPTPTVTDYCGVLARSKLLPADAVSGLAAGWSGTDADVDGFRKFVVARTSLTEYQAALVQRGYADGFFIGGYTILDRIGKGQQTAGVYKAVHPSGQIVAVKVLPGSKAKDPRLLARFEREGRLLTQLDHPNVVRAFQLGAAGGVHFIAMEHLDGETLDELLARRGKLPPAEAARVVYQALYGLQHLHERRMVHRDLKPANLMLCPPPPPGGPDTTLQATVKVVDIGLGRELFDEAGSSTHDIHLTAEGAILGTPDYLAPEQARDARGADVRSDIYSLGCVLFHAVCGRPPFVEKNVMAVMVRHASETPPAVGQFTPGVPPGLQVVLSKMLAKDPNGRPQTPSEAADALRPFLPANAPSAADADILPAYSRWLEDESREEPIPPLPPAAPRPASSPAVRIGPRPNPPPPVPGGTAASGPPAVKLPRPSGVVAPPSVKMKRPAGMLAPPSAGSGLAPPLKPPSTVRPSPLAAASPSSDYDVELVVLPGVRPPEAVDVGEKATAGPPPRPLWEPDRRDFFMLAIGAFGTLGAIGLGLFLARLNQERLREEDAGWGD